MFVEANGEKPYMNLQEIQAQPAPEEHSAPGKRLLFVPVVYLRHPSCWIVSLTRSASCCTLVWAVNTFVGQSQLLHPVWDVNTLWFAEESASKSSWKTVGKSEIYKRFVARAVAMDGLCRIMSLFCGRCYVALVVKGLSYPPPRRHTLQTVTPATTVTLVSWFQENTGLVSPLRYFKRYPWPWQVITQVFMSCHGNSYSYFTKLQWTTVIRNEWLRLNVVSLLFSCRFVRHCGCVWEPTGDEMPCQAAPTRACVRTARKNRQEEEEAKERQNPTYVVLYWTRNQQYKRKKHNPTCIQFSRRSKIFSKKKKKQQQNNLQDVLFRFHNSQMPKKTRMPTLLSMVPWQVRKYNMLQCVFHEMFENVSVCNP